MCGSHVHVPIPVLPSTIDMQAARRTLQKSMQTILGVTLEPTDPETLVDLLHGEPKDSGGRSSVVSGQ